MSADGGALTMGEQPAVEEARRLNPLTIFVRLLTALPQILIANVAVGVAQDFSELPWVVPAMAIGFVLLSGLAFLLTWWRFTYRLGRDEVRITSGVLSRNARSIPYERIQDVNIEQKLLPRIFGLAAVRLETGSSGGDDGELNLVSLEEAERLRLRIRELKAGARAASLAADASAAEDEQSHTIYAMDLRRVLIAGFFNFSLVIFAALGAVINQFDFLIPDSWYDPREWAEYAGVTEEIGRAGLAFQIIGLMSGLVGLIVTGLVRTLQREYGFTLDRTDTGLRRRRGLVTLTDVAMPLHRVQAALVLTNPIRIAFGWWSLKFQSLARDGKNESNHSVVPLGTREEVLAVLAEPGIAWTRRREDLRLSNPILFWTPVVLGLPVVALAVTAGAVGYDRNIAWLFLAMPLIAGIAWARWRAHRHDFADRQLYVHDGFWRRRLTILPVRKVQSVDVTQNFIYRRFGLANVVVGVAGGFGVVPLAVKAIPADEAMALRETLLPAGR